MRFRRKPAPPPLPMSPFDYLVAGISILSEVEADLEAMVLDLHNAIHCLDESGHSASLYRWRAQTLITALRTVQTR